MEAASGSFKASPLFDLHLASLANVKDICNLAALALVAQLKIPCAQALFVQSRMRSSSSRHRFRKVARSLEKSSSAHSARFWAPWSHGCSKDMQGQMWLRERIRMDHIGSQYQQEDEQQRTCNNYGGWAKLWIINVYITIIYCNWLIIFNYRVARWKYNILFFSRFVFCFNINSMESDRKANREIQVPFDGEVVQAKQGSWQSWVWTWVGAIDRQFFAQVGDLCRRFPRRRTTTCNGVWLKDQDVDELV